MTIQITTTVAQDDALAALNLISNPKDTPPIEVFAESVLTDKLDEVVADIKQRNITAVQSKLDQTKEQLTAQDLADVAAIVDKYIPQPVEIPAEVESAGFFSKVASAVTGLFK